MMSILPDFTKDVFFVVRGVAALRLPTALGCLALALMGAAANGQESETGTDRTGSAGPIERLTVTGRSRAELQREIERATAALLERFNEINSNRDFDTDCRERKVTGSNMTEVACQPRFMERAAASRGRQRVQGLQGMQNMDGNAGGGMGAESGVEQFEAAVRLEEMGDEMRRLVYEDDEFRALAAHLGELQQALANEDARGRDAGRTSAVIASAADMSLPYDARLMAEVSIGRKAWDHTLINRIFAIGHLFGEIEAMDLRCGRQRTRLTYQAEAEWTVPDGWEDCVLTIDAPRGTTFTLFEFE